MGRAVALGRFPGRAAGDPLVDLDLPQDRRSGRRGAAAGRPGRVDQGADRQTGRGRASRTTSRPIATRRRGCACGAAPRSSAAISRRCCRGSTGRSQRPGRASCEPASNLRDRQCGRARKDTPMPKVLISDALSPAAVAVFESRGIEADVSTGLSRERADRRSIAGYDGLAVRSATKVTARVLDAGARPQGGRPRRHRRRQHRPRRRHRARRRGDEHAVRQLGHHRRAHHRDDAGAGPPAARRRPLDPRAASGRSRASWAWSWPARCWG